MKKSLNVDLLNGDIAKSILIFSLPIILSYVFQQMYNAIDVMIVGNCLGDNSLAAIGASSSIFDMMLSLEQGICGGFGIVVARAYGLGDPKRFRRSIAGGIVLGAVITIMIMLFGGLSLRPLLRILRTPDTIIDEAYSYIVVLVLCIFVMFLYNYLAAILRAMGNSIMPVVFLIVSSITNVVLDYSFIHYLGMGIRGAAIATVLSQGLSVVLSLAYILLFAREVIPAKEDFRPAFELYKDMLEQGLSMALMFGIVMSGTLILQYAINGFSEAIIAGQVASRKVFNLATIPIFSISTAMATFASQNRGANKKERIKKGVHFVGILLSVWSLLAFLVMLFGSKQLIGLISGSSTEELLNYGKWYMIICSPFYVVLGWLVVIRNVLQGIGYKLLPVISSVVEFLGKVLFTVLIIPHTGTLGVMLCEPLIWVVMLAVLLYAYISNPYLRSK